MSDLRVLVLLAFVCVSVAGPAHASQAQIPTLPHAFYGEVWTAGAPVSVGARVEAQAAGMRVGAPYNPLVVTTAGQVGGPDVFNLKLVLQGEITEGTPVVFYVDGVKAYCAGPDGIWRSSYPFQAGDVTQVRLWAGGPPPGGLRTYLPLVLTHFAGGLIVIVR